MSEFFHMKNWTDWFNFFRETRQPLELGSMPEFGASQSDAMANMRRIEKRMRTNIDRLCLEWIKTGKWPEMTERERWFAGHRFSAAQLLLLILMSPGRGDPRLVPSRKTKRVDLLRWFLVETWGFSAHPVMGCDGILPPKVTTKMASLRN